jgi:ketosteroid isomerase-like protein
VSDATTADAVEARNLLAAFALATDLGTIDDYLALLTADAVIELAGRPPRNGAAEIRAGAEAGRRSGALGPGSHTMHMLGPSQVTLDGDTASALTPFVLFRSTDETPTPGVAGHYHDTLRRTAEGWKLAYRRMEKG